MQVDKFGHECGIEVYATLLNLGFGAKGSGPGIVVDSLLLQALASSSTIIAW